MNGRFPVSRLVSTTASVAALALVSASASALVLADKSAEQKLRKDINNQQIKYVKCLVNAAIKCESSGALMAQECFLATGTFNPPANSKGKFVGDIAKCDSKVDFSKKLGSLTDVTGYTGIGCPGDSNPGLPGDQPYSGIAAYQAGQTTKSQIDAIGLVLGSVAGPDPAVCGSLPPAKQPQCVNDLAKLLGKYASDTQKCIWLCENDYKNKKGNGGPTDGPNCALDLGPSANDGSNTSGSAAFNACVDKAWGKAQKKGGFPGLAGSFVLPQVNNALLNAANDLYNQNDCP